MNRQTRQTGAARSSWLIVGSLIVVTFIGSVLLVRYLRSRSTRPVSNSLLPDMPNKPRPLLRSFNGCPPEGDGGDPELNRLKNRIDDGQYIVAPFEEVERLDWPRTIERRRRPDWSAEDKNTVSRYEGLPLTVEGYVALARLEGPESPNCHGADSSFRDFHIWLTKNAGEDRTNSIVVEMTPALRAQHRQWTIETLDRISREKYRVRVSGWLLFDPDHPDQVGKTRGTIWELHPVMRFEVQQDGRWTPLDDFTE
jgi:hypothetical protein